MRTSTKWSQSFYSRVLKHGTDELKAGRLVSKLWQLRLKQASKQTPLYIFLILTTVAHFSHLFLFGFKTGGGGGVLSLRDLPDACP